MDVLTQKFVKTRKPHTCFGCGRVFPAGTRMEFSTIADGGTVDNSYLCEACLEVANQIYSEFGYFAYSFGELREQALLLEQERTEKTFGE